MVKMIAKRSAAYQGRALQAGDVFEVSEKIARQYRFMGKAVDAEDEATEPSEAKYATRVMTAEDAGKAAKPAKKAEK